MKILNFTILFQLFFVQAFASSIYGYDAYLPSIITSYQKDIQTSGKRDGGPQCESMYQPMLQDGVLDVRYAFGYFDDSRGVSIRWGGLNYGISPSLDLTVFEQFRKAVTSPCKIKQIRLCGFSQYGDSRSGKVILEKSMPIQGQDTLVRITMTYASVTEFYSKNTGALADEQRFFTEQSEENFFGGLKVADVVFYNGHSRNGGGPDFNPPILTSHKKTDYKGYYEIQKPGITRTLESLSQNPNPGFVLGLFSCFSRTHFYKDFMLQNPQQRLILSADTIDYFDSLKASIGYLEGILRGQCDKDLEKTAKRNEKVRRGFQQFQMK